MQKNDCAHKATQIASLATHWLETNQNLSTVGFSDEKRFSCDGPDSWRSRMLKSNPIVRNKRQQGVPALQVWGILLPGPMLHVFELPERGDSKDLMDFIEHTVLPYVPELQNGEIYLQQDNAPTHT